MQDPDPSIDHEGEVHMELDEEKPTTSTKDLDELRQKLEHMKAKESEEEMQHQLVMEGLKTASKEKELQFIQEINNLTAKREEMRRQSKEAEKSREYDLTIESVRYQVSIDEIKSQRRKVEEEIDLQRSSTKDILKQRQLEADMKAKLYEEEVKTLQKDYAEKEKNLKEIAVSEQEKHRATMAHRNSELASKYRQLEEQFQKENQSKMESIERKHRENIERLTSEAD